ncbi:MAG: HlyD family efflux transporter periplasmic adaptor subunit [Oligoflexia bacterium]|nr:HlyD family efflux transporter periplasmic adaptor subunit [Oligoflexia bacterium]
MTETKKKRPNLFLVLAAAAILVGVGVDLLFFREKFRYAGTLEATKIDLSAQVPSTISAVEVQEGDHVQRDQKSILLDCADIRVADELATENYDRNLRLYRSGTASKEVLDQMKNRKDDADVRLGWCEIKSPVNGTVLSRYHEPGEWVNPGTKILTLANIRDIWAYIYVPQPEVSRLKPGMKIKSYLPELHDREFVGTILKINDEAEFTPKNVQTRSERERLVYGVKVSFLGANDEEILKPGMTIEADLSPQLSKD